MGSGLLLQLPVDNGFETIMVLAKKDSFMSFMDSDLAKRVQEAVFGTTETQQRIPQTGTFTIKRETAINKL